MEGIVLVCLLAAACAAGFLLFRRNTIAPGRGRFSAAGKLSVIIPARNEENNLPYLLGSLQVQSTYGLDIIVVDDQSEDRTRDIAESFGVRVIESPPLPLGWTGKNWALPLAIGYGLYTVQIYYFVRYTGWFGRWLPAVHGVSTLFFLFVMLYSVIQVAFLGRVAWKGRTVKVGGKEP